MKTQLWIIVALLALIVLKLYASWVVVAVLFLQANTDLIAPLFCAIVIGLVHLKRRLKAIDDEKIN